MATPTILVVQCAALGWNLLEARNGQFAGMQFSKLTPPLPAVTCTAQATFRTGTLSASHGMVANGLYHPKLRKPLFWEQAAEQVEGDRIWKEFRAQGGTVGMMFWQQSLGEEVDLVLSPRPIHKHGGGMLQDCYSQPEDLYDRICSKVGKGFNLMHYWGPLASHRSSDWIVAATKAVLEMDECPDLLLTYLPHLDYDVQRHGPDHPKALKALDRLETYLLALKRAAEAQGRDMIVFGDYAMHAASGPAIFPNRALLQKGLFQTRRVKGAVYPDFWYGRAFAICDHEFAHIRVQNEEDVETARGCLQDLDGVEAVLTRREAGVWGMDHANSGELIARAEVGRWFAYPWWEDPKEAPDFAGHVDIHNKPGFDPCELFFGKLPWLVSQDTAKVGGCHGNDSPAVWASTVSLASEPVDLCGLSEQVKQLLGTSL